MKRWIKRLLLVVLLFGLAIQAFRPSRTTPTASPRDDVTLTAKVDPAVASTLQRSCRDCHSNDTRWPWYSHVAPVSWVVAHDVHAGREQLNLSIWRRYSENAQQKLLGKICEEVRDGEMPDTTYILMHREARLTQADAEAICTWTKTARLTTSPALQEVDD